MTKDQALDILAAHSSEIRRLGAESISLFGSVARGDASEDSDVDLLVEFEQTVGLLTFCRLRLYLEDILGCRVDLVTPDALKDQFRDRILREAIRAA